MLRLLELCFRPFLLLRDELRALDLVENDGEEEWRADGCERELLEVVDPHVT